MTIQPLHYLQQDRPQHLHCLQYPQKEKLYTQRKAQQLKTASEIQPLRREQNQWYFR